MSTFESDFVGLDANISVGSVGYFDFRSHHIKYSKMTNVRQLADKKLLLKQYEQHMERMIETLKSGNITLLNQQLRRFRDWAKRYRFYERTGIPVSIEDVQDYINKVWSDITKEISETTYRKRFNPFVIYLLHKHGLLYSDEPKCVICQQRKAYLTGLADITSYTQLLTDFDYLDLLVNKESVLQRMKICLNPICATQYGAEKGNKLSQEKLNTLNSDEIAKIRQIQSEKLKAYYSDPSRLRDRFIRQQIKHMPGKISGKENEYVAKTAVKFSRIIGATVLVKYDPNDPSKYEILDNQNTQKTESTGYKTIEVIDVVARDERIPKAIRLCANNTTKFSIPFLENITKEAYKQFTKSKDRNIELICKRCKTKRTKFVTHPFIDLVANAIGTGYTYDYIFRCEVCERIVRGRDYSITELYIKDLLSRILSQFNRFKVAHKYKPYVTSKQEIDIAVIDVTQNDIIVGIEIDGLRYHSMDNQAIKAYIQKWAKFDGKPVFGLLQTNLRSTSEWSVIPLAITQALSIIGYKYNLDLTKLPYEAGYDYLTIVAIILEKTIEPAFETTYIIGDKVSIMHTGRTLHAIHIHSILSSNEFSDTIDYIKSNFDRFLGTIQYVPLLKNILDSVNVESINKYTVEINKFIYEPVIVDAQIG